jgi:hypothetical protein
VSGAAADTGEAARRGAALADDAKEPRYVRTVYGFGYAFAAEAVDEAMGPRPPRPAAPVVVPRVLWEKRIIPLVEGENVIGREEAVTVRIDAPGASRCHACIRVRGDGATIEDLGSKNGTDVGQETSAITAPHAAAGRRSLPPGPHRSRLPQLGRVRIDPDRAPRLIGSVV